MSEAVTDTAEDAPATGSPMDYALVAAVLEHDYTVAPGTSRPYGNAVEDRAAALLNAGEMHRLLGSLQSEVEHLRLTVAHEALVVRYTAARAKRRKAQRDEARVVVEQVRFQLDRLRGSTKPDPCVEHDVFVERLRIAVGGSDGQGPEDWISAVEAGETAKDEEIRRLRAYIGDVDREQSVERLRGVTTRDGTVWVIRAGEQPVPGDRLPYGTVQPDGSVEPYPEELQQISEAIAKAGGEDWAEVIQFRRDLIRRDARAAFRWLAEAGFLSPSAPLREYGVVQDDLPPGVVMTAQALWDAMRPQFDPNDGWTYDEIGPLLRTFTQVLIDNRGLLGQATSDVVEVEATDG